MLLSGSLELRHLFYDPRNILSLGRIQRIKRLRGGGERKNVGHPYTFHFQAGIHSSLFSFLVLQQQQQQQHRRNVVSGHCDYVIQGA